MGDVSPLEVIPIEGESMDLGEITTGRRIYV